MSALIIASVGTVLWNQLAVVSYFTEKCEYKTSICNHIPIIISETCRIISILMRCYEIINVYTVPPVHFIGGDKTIYET